MDKLFPTLLALSLSLALAAMPVAAQQITTSQGVRTLPRTTGMNSELQLRQALSTSEQILDELLRDVEALDRSRTTASDGGLAIGADVKRANEELQRAKAAFEQSDKQYRESLAAFEQRQAALEADVQAQRTQGAVLEALPSAQRDHNEVVRINDWAAKIGKEREALTAERTRLIADHDRVEAERAAVAKQRAEAEAKLKASRDGVVGEFGGIEEKRNRAYTQLRTTLRHLESVRARFNEVATIKEPRSQLAGKASAKVQAWESRSPAASR